MGQRVLVVDDEKLIVKGIRFSLEQDNMEVDCAYDGEEALEKLRANEYDMVLLDIMLPKLTGLEVCQQLREFSNVPVIMLTANGAEQPIANYKSNAFPEVANNLILDGHTLGAVQAVITDNAWNKLTENQQAAVMEAAADTQAFNADLSETAENKVLDELKSSGCNVVDVPDKTPWQEACAKVISENTSDQAELYQQLLDMKA